MKLRAVLLIASFCMVLVLMQWNIQQKLIWLMGWCTYPLITLMHHVFTPLKEWKTHRMTMHEIREIVSQLQQEKNQLLEELIALRGVHIRAVGLDDLTRWAHRYNTDTLRFARVIGKVCSDEKQQLFLDVGLRDGIEVGMIAIFHNILVGRITDVYHAWCRVTTIVDRSSKIPIMCASTGTRAIYEGSHQSSCAHLAFVSHLNRLEKGDMLLSSGDGLIYPAGFAVGRIHDFRLDKRGLHYEVDVELLLDPSTLTHCSIVTQEVMLLPEQIEQEHVMINVGSIIS